MNLDESNSSTGSSSESSSGSSSSGSSSSSSGSGSSSSDSESSASDIQPTKIMSKPPKQAPVDEPKKKDETKQFKTPKPKLKPTTEVEKPEPGSPKSVAPRQKVAAKKKNAGSVQAKKKPGVKSAVAKSGSVSKPVSKQTVCKTESASKKKSIFSPENSSESEQECKNKPKAKKNLKKITVKIEKVENSEVMTNASPSNPTNNSPTKVNTDCKAKENPKKKVKAKEAAKHAAKKVPEKKIAPSVETAIPESEVTQKKDSAKTKSQKPEPQTSRGVSEAVGGAVPRKVTRSITTRMAKLVQTDSDSSSDAEGKTTGTRKDIKRVAKPRAALAKSPAARSHPRTPIERSCPVRGCDSTGHLGGVAQKHFTYDACPVYHNVTGPWCLVAAEERAKSAAAAKKAIATINQRPRSMPTIEQRAYQLKVKDLRSKWKGNPELKSKKNKNDYGEEREPILDGFAPDYDLKLFRDAQALVAIKKEDGLVDIPTDKGTRYVVLGKYMMEVLYQSPYPGDASRVPRLFVCEFCLKHQACETGASRHRAKCVWRHPPGDEIYRKELLSVWEVDGRKQKQYCQQLCLLAKFFLDHKTLYYDVEPFLFYVMTTADGEGCHIIGYFSKEKNSFLNYNVSCILTLPPYQRQGLGRLLIDFSYLLTKVEGKVGSPETPLSDLGLISYRSYWREVILNQLCSTPGPTLSIRDLSKTLGIASSDIISTLQERGLMKYWKGKHIVLLKEEVLKEACYRAASSRSVDPSCLRWWGRPAPR